MISDQIILINQTVLELLNEGDEVKIVTSFAKVGLKVLEADFGFVWLKSQDSKEWELVYKSPKVPFIPNPPREEGRNYTVLEKGIPDFVINTKKTPDAKYVSDHVESFVIIPLVYKKAIYGTMVLCFKKEELFSREKRILSAFIGNCVAQAITIRRLVVNEQKAREMEAQLKEEKTKIEFMANANHELRTPVTIIKGHIDLILRERGRENRRYADDAITSIDEEVKHLSNIISDLALLTTDNQEVKKRLIRKKVNLSKIVKAVVKRTKIIAKEKNIKIALKTKNISIQGDEKYLGSLFQNLIKNAVTYGKKNGWIKVVLIDRKTEVEIRVSDNGIGISEEDLGKIFNRFYRVDKSHSSEGKRTGLGLAIVKWIVEAHNGSIKVESSIGKGTAFIVLLPKNTV